MHQYSRPHGPLPSGLAAIAALGFVLCPAVATASGQPPSDDPQVISQSPESDGDLSVDPAAIALLESAWSWLGEQESYAVQADVEYDEVYGDMTRVQVSGRVNLLVRRPDRFKVFFLGDRGQKTYTYDGSTFAMNNLEARTWAAEEISGPNDTAVDAVAQKLDIILPLGDFIATTPAYTEDELLAAYLVGQSRVEGHRCHQILMSLDTLDVQVWIDADGNPFIRKLVLSYRTEPGQPQFEATFTDWRVALPLSDYVFTFVPDDSLRKVEFAEPIPGTNEE